VENVAFFFAPQRSVRRFAVSLVHLTRVDNMFADRLLETVWAVIQWRYRSYVLNNETVEVEM